jgi:hypothetical protein
MNETKSRFFLWNDVIQSIGSANIKDVFLIKKGTELVRATNLPADSKIKWWVKTSAIKWGIEELGGSSPSGERMEYLMSVERNYGIPIYEGNHIHETSDERDAQVEWGD